MHKLPRVEDFPQWLIKISVEADFSKFNDVTGSSSLKDNVSFLMEKFQFIIIIPCLSITNNFMY